MERKIDKGMINITIIKSTLFEYLIELRNNIQLCVVVCLLGVMCALWPDLWKNETTNSMTSFSLLISILALFISNYFIVENAIESRTNNKKNLFSEYCTRFSSNQNISKVAEWLLAISEFDTEGILINVYPKRLNDDKGRTIVEPTFFEMNCFGDFLIELNIQTKNKQLEKEDVRKYFSPYALIFDKVIQSENKQIYYMRNLSDLSEMLS